MTPERPPAKTATACAYDAIKQRILEGTYQADEYVRELSIAKELEVSRTPVREALRELISEGWLEAIPHQGARVSSWSEQDAREIFEIRLHLEPLAIYKAASLIEASLLQSLQQLATRMEKLAEQPDDSTRAEIALLNHEFHRELITASKSQRLVMVLDNIVRPSTVHRNFQHYRQTDLQRSMRHHREMLDAIEAGNASWAESVMRAHLLAGRDLHTHALTPKAD
ncbi:MAG: GntR family transcriptional regulator [Halomonas sp.]|uniref:GntR family transcriptional regulator n=1 Tax=Halomonas sp. TaxID=1486246 RepID=UPI003F919F32